MKKLLLPASIVVIATVMAACAAPTVTTPEPPKVVVTERQELPTNTIAVTTPEPPKVVITERQELQTDTIAVTAVLFSPDGKTLATRTRNGTPTGQVWETILWDVETGDRVRTLPSAPSSGIGVAFSPDSTALALGGFTLSVSLIDPQDGHEIKTMEKIESLINPPIFSPDGKLIAATQNGHAPSETGGKIAIWNVDSGNLQFSLEGAVGDLSFVPAFSPDGKQIAAGAGNLAGNLIILWDTQTGQLLRTISGPTAAVRSVAYSPDGKDIASSSATGDVEIWDVTTGERRLALDAREGGYATAITYSPDGTLLACATYSGQVLLWDAGSGAPIASFDAHTGYKEDNPSSIAFSGDGRILAAAGGDGLIVLWDIGSE